MFNNHSLGAIAGDISGFASWQRLKHLMTAPLYRNAVYLIINAVTVGLFSFVFWIVVARLYDETTVGYSSAIISAATIISTLTMFGFNATFIRFLPQLERSQELINSCLTLCGLATLVAVGISLATVDIWSPALVFLKRSIGFASVFCVLTLILVLGALVGAVYVAGRQCGFVLWHNAIASVIKIVLPFVFLPLFYSFGIVASWAIAFAVAFVVSVLVFMPKVNDNYKPIPTLKLGLIKSMWRYSVGNYVAHIFMVIPPLALPIMVVNILSPEQNAYFYIAWMASTLLATVSNSMALSLFAEGTHFEERLREHTIKSLKFIFLLLVPVTIVLILAGKWILMFFGQNYSTNALSLLRIFAISSLPLSVVYIYTSILRVAKKIKELMVTWGFVAVVVLGVSYLILPVVGIIGIGYTWLGVHCVLSVYIIVFRMELW